jgi:two-component system chemotaxis response regulator CheY
LAESAHHEWSKATAEVSVPGTVLIVDDSPTIRGFAKIFLKSLGITILEAEDGMQALEVVRAHAPDVAVVDINMPGMDGLTFTRELRQDARFSKLPIILLTGDRSEETRQKGLEAGASDFIEKPIRGAELQAAVKKQLEARGT